MSNLSLGFVQWTLPGSEYIPIPILCAVLAVLVWVTYTDITENLIKNLAIAILFLLGFGYLGMDVWQGYLSWWAALLHIFVPGAVALGLYFRNVWGAGDGKLYWATSLILPLRVDNYGYILLPGSFLLTGYAVLFLYLSVSLIVVIWREERGILTSLKDSFAYPWRFALTFCYQYIGFIGAATLTRQVLQLPLGVFQGMLVTPLILSLLQWVAGKRWVYLFAPFVLYGVYGIVRDYSNAFQYVGSYFILLFFLVLRQLAELVQFATVPITKVRPGTILEDYVSLSVVDGHAYVSVRRPLPDGANTPGVPQPDRHGGTPTLITHHPGQVSTQFYEQLRRHLGDGPIPADIRVRVRRTVPFAPAVAVAYIVTLVWTV